MYLQGALMIDLIYGSNIRVIMLGLNSVIVNFLKIYSVNLGFFVNNLIHS